MGTRLTTKLIYGRREKHVRLVAWEISILCVIENKNDISTKPFDKILTNLTCQLNFKFFITKCFNMATLIRARLICLEIERENWREKGRNREVKERERERERKRKPSVSRRTNRRQRATHLKFTSASFS